MKFLTLVCGLVTLATSVLCLDTVGVPGATRPRYEIRQLQSDFPKQYDLFIQAMAQYQKKPTSDVSSYYQIAGIHGVPRATYDGVGQCGSCQSAIGYCTHSSINFLGWHRAYLALFEQELVKIAKTIAATYPQGAVRASYQAAATSLRLPYWDWAARPASGNNLPTQIASQAVSINTPQGRKSVVNPLFSYTFQAGRPLNGWPKTIRYPTNQGQTAQSDQGKGVAAFNNIRGNLQDQLYQIFSTCDSFEEVGLDKASTGTKRCSNSLEMIHNTVHTVAGGPGTRTTFGGHMTYITTAAFDPIFWLHHCNIDRLFAMWQAVNPSSYTGSSVQGDATWTIPKGSTQNLNSPLTPFRRSGGGFWTSVQVRRWQNLHYTYPEFAHSDGSAQAISGYINNLYGPNARGTAANSKRQVDGDVSGLIAPLVANNGSLFQYVANIETPRYALNGSYNIYLFNGNPTTSDPASYLFDANLIGLLGILSTSAMDGSDLVAAGSIPLTRTLTDVVTGGLLSDLTEAMVVPYLVENLQWIIVGPDGTEIDPSSIPDFDIKVFASTATQVSDGELPVWSEFIELFDVADARNLPAPSPSASAAPSGSADASATPTANAATTTATNDAQPTDAAATTTTDDAQPTDPVLIPVDPARLRRRAIRY